MRIANSDQTGQMPRLIWVFAGCTGHFAGFVMRQLIFSSAVISMTTYLICKRYCAFWICSSDPVMVMMRSFDPGNASSITIWAPDWRLISMIREPPLPMIAPANCERRRGDNTTPCSVKLETMTVISTTLRQRWSQCLIWLYTEKQMRVFDDN